MTYKEFQEKLKENKDLLAQFRNCKSPEEAYEIAKSMGLSDSIETFKDETEKLKKKISDLSEEEIAAVAGGNDLGIPDFMIDPNNPGPQASLGDAPYGLFLCI